MLIQMFGTLKRVVLLHSLFPSISFAQHYKKALCSSNICLQFLQHLSPAARTRLYNQTISLVYYIGTLTNNTPSLDLADVFPCSPPFGSRKRSGRHLVRPCHPVIITFSLTLDRAGGLPKKTETCYFFRINDAYVHEFRTQLGKLVPLITSTAEVINDQRKQLAQNKKDAAEKKITPPLLKMSGVNISFSTKGLKKVSQVA